MPVSNTSHCKDLDLYPVQKRKMKRICSTVTREESTNPPFLYNEACSFRMKSFLVTRELKKKGQLKDRKLDDCSMSSCDCSTRHLFLTSVQCSTFLFLIDDSSLTKPTEISKEITPKSDSKSLRMFNALQNACGLIHSIITLIKAW